MSLINKAKKAISLLRQDGVSAVPLILHRVTTSPDKEYAHYASLSPEEYPDELKKWYKLRTGQALDLDHPRTFNEKIQWLKLYDSTPLKTRLADKYLARDWVAEKIGSEYLVPLLGVWDSFDEIDFAALPERFVLKCNHGSGWNLVVKDKSKLNKADAKKKFDKWMNMNYAFCSGLELHYKDIPPKIIAEQYIEEKDGNLYDYKIFCFNGEPKYIQVIGDRDLERHTAYEAFYDPNWHNCKYTYTYPLYPYEVPKPEKLDDILRIAMLLSGDFCFVRVDLYCLGDRVYVGEMTFTPASGADHWSSEECNLKMGSKIQLPSDRQAAITNRKSR